ncbi:hypothetical protein [Bacillus dakarensis]|uniref:hypothetical protein n=1 Tax=Robertmurraya dakarensis TaxID=1926278 RepID=UPI0009819F49|nr:hypothetical protein [Bacillus dakarensis]
MTVIHFFDHNNVVLTQLRSTVPVLNENIKIKGRKGKVASITQIDDHTIHVHVLFEKVQKPKPSAKDTKKKK